MTDHFLQVTPDLQEKFYIIESTMRLIGDTVKRLATARSFIMHTVYISLETGTELVTYYWILFPVECHCQVGFYCITSVRTAGRIFQSLI